MKRHSRIGRNQKKNSKKIYREIFFAAKVRGSAASLTTAFNWMCTFVVTKAFTDIIGCLGNHGAFWMFCGICTAGLFFVYFFVPETRGKSLEDIERKFAKTKSPTRRLSSIANLKPTPLSVWLFIWKRVENQIVDKMGLISRYGGVKILKTQRAPKCEGFGCDRNRMWFFYTEFSYQNSTWTVSVIVIYL